MSDSSFSFHSVRLDPDKCVGCTTCLKKCPTEAIRVRKGKAHIIDARCIDCGECIRTCPHGAKKAVSDPLSSIEGFRIKVAVPAPTLYGQFDERYSIDRILGALLDVGFDEVYEVAEAAELVTDLTRDLLAQALGKTAEGAPGDAGKGGMPPLPIISSACPAVVKLIQVRFPSLIPNLMPLLPPVEVAARIVKERLHPGEEGVGVFLISPCAGKVTTIRAPVGYAKSALDGAIGIKDLYLPLRAALNSGAMRERGAGLGRAGSAGIEWARTEGECDSLGEKRSISVDGIASVIGVLEAIENGKLKDLAYVEALACPAGCLGGPLTVENPYIARSRLRNRAAALSPRAASRGLPPPEDLSRTEAIKPRAALLLDPDMLKAMIMLEEIEQLSESLPGLDCGSCGAPSCRALAEDIIRGSAVETDCIFKLRETVRDLAGQLLALEQLEPPGLDKEEEKQESPQSEA
jgi:iron only hydrogenase large subunit-like protein